MPVFRNCIVFFSAFLTLFFVPSLARAGELGVTVKLAYVSKYIWGGLDLWNNNPAIQPDVWLTIGDSGPYAGVWSSYSVSAGCVDQFGESCPTWDEHDYYGGYTGRVAPGAALQTDYDLSYTYYHFFRRTSVDFQMVALSLTHPGLLPALHPSAPTLYWDISYGWTVEGNGPDSRWFRAGLKKEIAFAENTGATVLAETVWDDGAGSYHLPKGWSHVKAGVKGLAIFGPAALEPAIYHQWKLKDAEPADLLENELWYELTLTAAF